MAMKPRVLYLMQFLQKNSDDLHPVTTAKIRKALADKGCPVSVLTLRTDIASLIEAGYDIDIHEKEGCATSYSWKQWELSAPELQILVDAVSSSQFLALDMSRELIRHQLIRPQQPDSGICAIRTTNTAAFGGRNREELHQYDKQERPA